MLTLCSSSGQGREDNVDQVAGCGQRPSERPERRGISGDEGEGGAAGWDSQLGPGVWLVDGPPRLWQPGRASTPFSDPLLKAVSFHLWAAIH